MEAREPTFNPRETASYLFKEISRVLTRRAEALLRPIGLGVAYLPVLTALKRGEATTQAQLVRLLGVEQPSMAQLLSRMERDGLIARDDGHVRTVTLTTAGRKKLTASIALLNEGNIQGLQRFTPEESEQLTSLLNRYLQNLRPSV